MRRALLGSVVFLGFWFPSVVFADCTKNGYTVFYINGILASSTSPGTDAHELGKKFAPTFNNEVLNIKAAANPSKLLGFDDVLKTLKQIQFWNDGAFHEDTDVDTILNQIHDELTTQKVLLVGHSQGTFYANDIYYYLTTHGMSKDAVGVYAVATPAGSVAGGGAHLTSFNDHIIANIRQNVLDKPYLYGVTLPLYSNFYATPGDDLGHYFVSSYLNKEPDTVVGDIDDALSKLKPTYDSDIQGECFTPPPSGTIQKVSVFVKDHGTSLAEAGYVTTVAFAEGSSDFAHMVAGALASLFSPPKISDQGATDATFGLLNSLNLTSIDAKTANQLQDKNTKITDLGAAAILAVDDTPVDPTTTEPTTTAMVPIATTTFPVAPTTTAPTDQHAPMPAAVVLQGSAERTVVVAAAPALAAPTNLVFSNWRSSDGNTNCDVITRTVDVSWISVTGATGYELWQYFSGDDHLMATTSLPTASNLTFSLGLNWAIPISLKVVAFDGAGDYATTSVSVNDAATDKTGPFINSVVPAYGSTGVSTTSSIAITYSEPVDSASLSGSFGLSQIIDTGDGSGPHWESVPFTSSAGTDTVTLTPDSLLATSTSYGVFASCGVKDLNGNHGGILTSDLIHPSFTTEP